jgi:hypothetical protein
MPPTMISKMGASRIVDARHRDLCLPHSFVASHRAAAG